MLAIRMQRTGRKGHAMFRVVVQDSRRTPTSGKIVAQLGSYDPHGKAVIIDKDKASFYLTHGAQPSERAARLLKSEGVKLPDWVNISDAKAGKIRHLDKLRRNQPKEEVVAEEPAVEEAAAPEAEATETPDTAPEAEAPAEAEATPEAAADTEEKA
jgi:small subunit ribosomal protein S16